MLIYRFILQVVVPMTNLHVFTAVSALEAARCVTETLTVGTGPMRVLVVSHSLK